VRLITALGTQVPLFRRERTVNERLLLEKTKWNAKLNEKN
jgi:hypothetical protein